MAAFARDLLGHKYFQECNGGDRKVGTRIYFLSIHSIIVYGYVFMCASVYLPVCVFERVGE